MLERFEAGDDAGGAGAPGPAADAERLAQEVALELEGAIAARGLSARDFFALVDRDGDGRVAPTELERALSHLARPLFLPPPAPGSVASSSRGFSDELPLALPPPAPEAERAVVERVAAERAAAERAIAERGARGSGGGGGGGGARGGGCLLYTSPSPRD